MTAAVFPVPNVFTVQLKGCCDGMPGDWCDCAAWYAEAAAAWDTPIVLPSHGPLAPIEDPALRGAA